MKTFSVILTSVAIALCLSACVAGSGGSSGKPRKDASSATGYYIPHDLEDALAEVDRIMGAKGRADVLKVTEGGMVDYHFGLGLWMRNNWLRRESRLEQYFNQLGIRHRDDMSGIILDSYWRRIHGRPIDLEGQVRHYQDFWKKAMPNDGG